MQEVLGRFVDIDPAARSILDLSFSVNRDARAKDWRKNDACACFVAGYTGKAIEEFDTGRAHFLAELSANVNYVANEMLESAMLAHAGADGPIVVKVRICERDLRLYVKSECAPDNVRALRQQAANILASDPGALYFERLSQPCQSEQITLPDLGFLSMMVDYDADLAWKFEGADPESANVSVTTMTAMRI